MQWRNKKAEKFCIDRTIFGEVMTMAITLQRMVGKIDPVEVNWTEVGSREE
jgi:hypothetical protein